MGQAFQSLTYGTDSGAAGFARLGERTDTLRSCFSGVSAPSAPVDGQLWFDTGNLILFYYDGSGWVGVGTVIEATADFNLNQVTNARMENTAGNPTPAAGNVGYIILHTGAGKLKVVTTSTVLETIVSLSNADLWKIPMPLNTWWMDGTNPPTENIIGTTPKWYSWLFDAITERMHTNVILPRGFSEDADVMLRIHYLLNAPESASDVLAGVVDYKKLILDSTDAADGTSTQAAAVSQSIGANAGQYTYHKCDILLAYNDANNPLTGANALALSFGLSAVSSVAAAAVIHAELLSPVGQVGITEIA